MTVPGSPAGKVTLAYILSPSHSGSTLLAMLLGSHPGICTVGELKATSLGDPRTYRCSCLREIRECPFWRSISSDMAALGLSFSPGDPGTNFGVIRSPYAARLLRPLHRGPVLEAVRDLGLSLSPEWRRTLPMVLRQNLALVRCLSARTGKGVVVDSSKIGLRLKYLLRIPELDVKVIRLVRDGRGVSLTYMNQDEYADASDPALRGGGTGNRGRYPGLPMAAAAREWRRSTEEGEEIVSRLDPSRWVEVRYERLCSDPEGEVNRLFSFLGVERAGILDLFRSREHHVIGNGMRLDGNREIRLDERWRDALDGKSLREFDAVAGRLNRSLGYE